MSEDFYNSDYFNINKKNQPKKIIGNSSFLSQEISKDGGVEYNQNRLNLSRFSRKMEKRRVHSFKSQTQVLPEGLSKTFKNFLENKTKTSHGKVDLPYLSFYSNRNKSQSPGQNKNNNSQTRRSTQVSSKFKSESANFKHLKRLFTTTPFQEYDSNEHVSTPKVRGKNFSLSLSAILKEKHPGYKKVIHSETSKGLVIAFGVNSYKGLNESNTNRNRVTILLSISKPNYFKGKWPENLSLFGVFEGHDGNKCANFLRDKAHLYLIQSIFFPNDIESAVKDAFERLEKDFLEKYAVDENNQLKDKSGSCAIIVLIIESIAYIINLGDSRAILSLNKGKKVVQLSNDHSPKELIEKNRIVDNRGFVYKAEDPERFRVVPGNLPVSRCIGDACSKLPIFGGRPGVIIATPQITKINIDEINPDFILLGNHGIFDNLQNEEIVNSIWETLNHRSTLSQNIHLQAGTSADLAIKIALNKKTKDNLTSIFICFGEFLKAFNKKKEKLNKKTKKTNLETLNNFFRATTIIEDEPSLRFESPERDDKIQMFNYSSEDDEFYL